MMTTRTTTSRSTATADRSAASRALLTCGMVAGPLFVVSSLLQAFTRDGFDLRVHPFSMLSLGDLGWVQVTTFVLAGLQFLACAAGMRGVLRPGGSGTWGPVLIGAFGAAQIGGGVFPTDPSFGFPQGASAGMPVVTTWQSSVHGLAFAVGFASLVAASFVIARSFATAGDRGWARYSAATGAAVLVLAGIGIVGGDFRIVAVAIVLGWGWVSLVAAHLR